MTFIIAHEVVATATRFDGSAGGGWSPRLSVTLGGPVPPAAELVWAVQHSDGWPWFEHRVEVPERAAGELATVELQHRVEGVDGHDAGEIRFSLALGSAFGGAEELVHDGLLRVERVEGLGYVVDESARVRSATLALDAADEADAPPLRIAAYLPGEFETHRVSVHCFRAGERLAEASRVWNERVFTSHEGRVTGQQVAAVFESVRGWNNLAASGWGEGWHLLDHHDGDYELRFVLGSQLLRTVTFSVLGGRIVAQGPIEIDRATGHALLLGDAPSASFYGVTPAPEALATIADIYALRRPTIPAAGSPAASEPPTGGAAAGAAARWSPPADALSVASVPATGAAQKTAPAAEAPSDEALTAYAERVERLLATWESEMTGARPPYELQQVLEGEAVLRERPGYAERAAAVAAADDACEVTIAGESRTLGELRERMRALFTAAESRLHTAASDHDDALAPYRQVLTGDKLALFDDRPIGDFEYRTLDRTIISTPEELRDAEYWFFEGPTELTSTAALDGDTVKVTTTGWRVVGWRFTPDGTIADQIEHQGPGPDAPLWAYRAPAESASTRPGPAGR